MTNAMYRIIPQRNALNGLLYWCVQRLDKSVYPDKWVTMYRDLNSLSEAENYLQMYLTYRYDENGNRI